MCYTVVYDNLSPSVVRKRPEYERNTVINLQSNSIAPSIGNIKNGMDRSITLAPNAPYPKKLQV